MTTIFVNMLAFATLLSSVFSITSKNPVISVIFLISTFVSGAGYLMLIGINFVGISYIIVYVGAIAVLFLFVIMMINIKLTDILETGSQYTKNLPLAIAIGSLFIFIIFSIIPFNFNNVPAISIFLDKITYLNTILSGSSNSLANNCSWSLQQVLSMDLINSIVTNNLSAAATNFTGQSSDVIITDFQQIESLGYSLYTYGAVLLITLSVILLLAMFATIVISKINHNAENASLSKDNINVNQNCSPLAAYAEAKPLLVMKLLAAVMKLQLLPLLPQKEQSSSSNEITSSIAAAKAAATNEVTATTSGATARLLLLIKKKPLLVLIISSLLFIFALLSFNCYAVAYANKFELFYFFNEFNFWLKFCFILFLFFTNVILMFQDYYYYENVKDNSSCNFITAANLYLEAGVGQPTNKIMNLLKVSAGGVISLLGLLSSYYTLKNYSCNSCEAAISSCNSSFAAITPTKKSSILDFDFDWFESLSGIKKLAVSLLLLNSVLFSCLLNIIFIFYGNILINKFNLEVRYPKLAKIIHLRQLYTKYYLIINCLLILGIILAQVAFSLAILLL